MDIFSILEEVQIIARNGLNYSTNLYDRERYERLLNLAAQNYSELLDLPLVDIRSAWRVSWAISPPRWARMPPSSTRRVKFY